jgi:hypothetical protein
MIIFYRLTRVNTSQDEFKSACKILKGRLQPPDINNVDYFPWIDNLFGVTFARCHPLCSLPKKILLQTFVQRGRQ